MTEQRIDEKLLDEATEWFVRMRADGLSDRRVEDFLRWINQTEVHQAAYARIGGLWDDLSILESAPPVPANQASASDGAVASLTWHKRQKAPRSDRRSAFGRFWSPRVIAASIAFLAISFFGLRYGDMLLMDRYATETGELAEFILEDGSHLVLNTKSKIRVDLREDRRVVYLEGGEVFFEVARDASRPFYVETSGGLVKVLGTRFNVRHKGDYSDVTVLEGSVGVVDYGRVNDSIHGARKLDATLTPDQKFTLGNDRVENRAVPVDSKAVLSWRDRKLVYNGETFATLVEDINRYYDAEIRIGDPALQDIEVVAILTVEDRATTLKALEATFNITARPVSSELIYLYPNK